MAETNGLLNRRRVSNSTESSNLSPSARSASREIELQIHEFSDSRLSIRPASTPDYNTFFDR